MYYCSFPLFLFFARILTASAAESCACEAEHLGFAINCDDTATMMTAFNVLQSSSCANDCTSDDCVKNYYIVQAHHDYCTDSQVPVDINFGFHDFDASCVPCNIQRRAIDGAPDCPVATCNDGSGNAAYSTLLDASCLSDCTSEACGTQFLTLLVVHDNCPHDALSQAAEEGYHDMEESCGMHVCNAATSAANQLVCNDHSNGESSTSSNVNASMVTVITIALSSMILFLE